MSTGAQILARVRQHLEEAAANEFLDAALYAYISDGQRFVAGELRNANRSWFEKESAALPLVADAAYVAMPSDFVDLVLLEYVGGDGQRYDMNEIPPGERSQSRDATTIAADSVPGFWLRNSRAYILPVSSAARSFIATYGYEPAAVASPGAADLETPDRYDKIVALYAAINAIVDDRRRPGDWTGLLETYLGELRQRERSRTDMGHAESVQRVHTRRGA